MGYLLENIECSDSSLQAAIAKVRTDTDGAREDFELAVSELLPVDPFVKNKAASKSVTFAISGVDGEKPGRGNKTGVDLRWYDSAEWKRLSSEEQEELREWRKTNDGKKATEEQHAKKFGSPSSKRKKKANKGNANKKLKAKLASLEKELDEKNAASDEDNLTSQIAAAIKDAGSAPPKSDEDKNRSIARSILSITARKK